MPEEIKTLLASESCHYYGKDGSPKYTVIGKNGNERPTTLRDARANGWVPSVSTILSVADKPGLNIWKATQLLQSALTLPKLEDETLDDYAKRVIEDSKAQGKKAAERGTELHAAIEDWILTGYFHVTWENHIITLRDSLIQYGIDLKHGKAEHSFASPLGYGGKIDWHDDLVLIDFKTKAKVKDVKQLAWPENCWQLSAYSSGVAHPLVRHHRLLNVFIGVDDCEVRIHEWPEDDAENGWRAFQHLLAFWQITKNYNGQTP